MRSTGAVHPKHRAHAWLRLLICCMLETGWRCDRGEEEALQLERHWFASYCHFCQQVLQRSSGHAPAMIICGTAKRYQGSSGISRGYLLVRTGASKPVCVAPQFLF